MFMRSPKFVRFEQDVLIPKDDVFRHEASVVPVWRGHIESGSSCVYQGRKADIVYVTCPVAIDARETKVVVRDEAR
jgi:hypothetical protein